MILRIARKEIRDLVRDGRFRWSAVIVTVLLTTSAALGWRSWRELRAEQARAQAEARNDFDEQGEKNPHAAAHYGLYVFKPKPPLSFVDPGVDPYTGVSVHLEAHRRNEVGNRPARDATALQRFGELTAASVLQLLLPLLIIFLAFPALAGEREQGTLRQVLSLGVRPGTLIWGKAVGLVVALSLIVAPVLALGVSVVVLGSAESARTWPHALAMLAGYVLYLGIFLAVALLVSMRSRTTRVALVVLLGFWILNAMIAPRLATDLARRTVPTPSSLQFTEAIRRDIKAGVDGHDPEDSRIERLKQETLKKYQAETVEDLPINFQGIALQAGEEYGNSVFDRHYGALWTAFGRQDTMRKALGFLFPTLAIRELSMALAGTDNQRSRDFAESAERYRRDLVLTLNRDLEQNGADLGFMYQAGPELWRGMPEFRYQPPALHASIQDQTMAWAALVLWLSVTVGLVCRSTRTLRVD